MDYGLKNKVALITGSGRGLGAQIAETLQNEGAKVIITDVNEANAAETAKRFVARLPHGTLELVPDAGHAPWIDEPERATTSTRAFLNG